MKQLLFLLAFLLPLTAAARFQSGDPGWWPLQQQPATVLTCTIKHPSDLKETNLAQSVSGLVAQALNNGATTEGVWIATANANYKAFYTSLIKRLPAQEGGAYDVWRLVDRYKARGIIKGYILYNADSLNNSINLATVLAALKQGVLVDASQEDSALRRGLARLDDARGRSWTDSLFRALRPRLNPGLLVVANPKYPNNRDYAIAHKSMVYYGVDSLLHTILAWTRPLSPVIGWNSGGESTHIEPCTRWGLLNTASDWCVNLPLLTIPATAPPVKLRTLDPDSIHWQENDNHHAFVLSDGDNMQWTFGSFLNNPDYWANAYNADIPMSFTSCVVNLAMAGIDVYNRLAATQPPHTSVVEYGGGYYYPDQFATRRPNPDSLLRALAAKINIRMQQTGTKVFGFICRDVDGPAALNAYRIYAEEIEGLTGMIAVQYHPYNGGKGQVFWVKNKAGADIPVVCARYQQWADLPLEGSGDPAAIAGWINNDAAQSTSARRALSWTIVHAWSYFNNERGVTPVKRAKDLVSPGTRIVSIEELLWRIRKKHTDSLQSLVKTQKSN